MNPLIRTTIRYLGLLLTLAFLASFACCGGQKEVKKPAKGMDVWQKKAEESKGYSPSPRGKVLEPRPGKPERGEEEPAVSKQEGAAAAEKEPAAEKQLPKKLMTLKMTEDWEVAKLLRFMARVADKSIMINESVKGSSKINVKKAPWDQVFLGILKSNGLTYEWQGEIIRIVTLQDRENDRKLVEAKTKMLLEQAEYEVKLKTLKAEAKRLEPYETRVVYINYTDATEIARNLEMLLDVHRAESPAELERGAQPGSPQDGFKRMPSIAVDTHNNALILHAIEADIIKMADLIQKLDRPTPQILIESQIVETTRGTARELGIKWGGLYHGTNGGKNYYVGPGFDASGTDVNTAVNPESDTAANFPANFLDTATAGTTSAAGALQAIADPAGLTIGFLSQSIGKYILDVELSALQKAKKLEIISTPSITTIDNKEAMIESGRKIPYQTVDRYGNINIKWENAVLQLKVTPHVVAGEILSMRVEVKKDEADFSEPVQGTPTIITRKAETTVVLLDGQTTVIGGLGKDTTEKSGDGIPGLMDIPMFSWLFKRDRNAQEMDQLLIFLTPHILKSRDREIRQVIMEKKE